MTCKDCLYYAKGCEFIPSDLDSDVFDYCRKGITDEIPDIEERCNDFENKTDWVKVVRCKDCKHRGMWKCTMFIFSYSEWAEAYVGIDNTEDDGFCHYGERE